MGAPSSRSTGPPRRAPGSRSGTAASSSGGTEGAHDVIVRGVRVRGSAIDGIPSRVRRVQRRDRPRVRGGFAGREHRHHRGLPRRDGVLEHPGGKREEHAGEVPPVPGHPASQRRSPGSQPKSPGPNRRCWRRGDADHRRHPEQCRRELEKRLRDADQFGAWANVVNNYYTDSHKAIQVLSARAHVTATERQRRRTERRRQRREPVSQRRGGHAGRLRAAQRAGRRWGAALSTAWTCSIWPGIRSRRAAGPPRASR